MEKEYIKISEYAQRMGLHVRTAYRYFHKGTIKGFQDETTDTIFIENPFKKKEDKSETKRVILYARVSSSTNKQSLDGQIERLRLYSIAKGYTIVREVKEIASGLNDDRKQLNSILNSSDWDILVVEHKERLTRFGFNYFTTLLKQLDKSVEVINETVEKTKNEELMNDFISIITSFCGRLYGSNRKTKSKEIIEKLNEDITNV